MRNEIVGWFVIRDTIRYLYIVMDAARHAKIQFWAERQR
jgi:hypothetical protein